MLIGYLVWGLVMLAVVGALVALLMTLPVLAAVLPATLTLLAVVIGMGVIRARRHRRRAEDHGPETF